MPKNKPNKPPHMAATSMKVYLSDRFNVTTEVSLNDINTFDGLILKNTNRWYDQIYNQNEPKIQIL